MLKVDPVRPMPGHDRSRGQDEMIYKYCYGKLRALHFSRTLVYPGLTFIWTYLNQKHSRDVPLLRSHLSVRTY